MEFVNCYSMLLFLVQLSDAHKLLISYINYWAVYFTNSDYIHQLVSENEVAFSI